MALSDKKNQISIFRRFHSKDIPKSCIKLNHEFHPAIIVTASRYQPARTSIVPVLPIANPSMNVRATRTIGTDGIQAYRDPRPPCSISSHDGFSKDDPTHPIIPDRSPRNFLTCFLNFGHAPAYVIPHTSVPWPTCLLTPSLLVNQASTGNWWWWDRKFISNNNILFIYFYIIKLVYLFFLFVPATILLMGGCKLLIGCL